MLRSATLRAKAKRELRGIVILTVAAGIVLVLFSMGSDYLLESNIQAAKSNTAEINISGRQRMLTERIATLAQNIATDHDKKSITQLKTAIRQMNNAHLALLQGSRGMGLVKPTSPYIKAMYFEPPFNIDQKVEAYLDNARKFAFASASMQNRENPHYKILQTSSDSLIAALDSVTDQYELEGKINAVEIMQKERAVLVAEVLTIVLIGIFVVLPMIRRIRDDLQKIFEAELFSKTIMDRMIDGLISIKEDGIIRSFNLSAEQIFGYQSTEVAGKHIKALIPDLNVATSDRWRDVISDDLHTSRALREMEGRRKDGSSFPIELGISEMNLGDQRFFVCVVRDFTEKKEAENQLNLFFSLSIDMFCIAASDGYFKRISPAFTKILGWSEEEILARPFIELVHPDDRPATIQAVEQQISEGKSVLHFENRYLHKDGSWRTLSWVSVPYSGGLLFATARDVTESKQTEQILVAAKERAEMANRAKDSFLETMSHEIRTPLSGMLGMLEVLSLTSLDEEQNTILQAAWGSGRSLLRIVSDILDWSRIQEGKLAIDPHPTSISQLMQDVVNTYSRVASSKSLKLYHRLDACLGPTYLVDALRLSQILNNFVSNAIKFTKRGEIELKAELLGRIESGDRIRFSVRDTGMGIPKESQQHLFQRYQQGSVDTTRLYGGTGLGLAICRRLVDMMDGQIEVDSEPGRGATFSITLTLPVSGTPGEPAPIQEPETWQRDTIPLHVGSDGPVVLIVDDHPINRDLLSRQIRLLGLRTETAEDGKKALAKWHDNHFSAVITDCHMPELDGYGLSQAIRAAETAKQERTRVPIIGWTANAVGDEAGLCQAAGMDDLLIKPTDMKRLKETLKKWLLISGIKADSPAGPSANGSKQATPIDYAELEKVTPDRDSHQQLLHDFLRCIQTDRAKLTVTIDKTDQLELERTAHRMKGSGRMVGATEMADICASIEHAARNGDLEDARSKCADLDAEIDRLENHITGEVGDG